MALSVTVSFAKGGQLLEWEAVPPKFSKVLSNFASRNFETASVNKEVVQFTATTSTKTQKEVAKLISNVSARWKSASGVEDVAILRKYTSAAEEPKQSTASSSSQAPPQRAWEPTAKWLRAAGHHFASFPSTPSHKGVIVDVCAPTTK